MLLSLRGDVLEEDMLFGRVRGSGSWKLEIAVVSSLVINGGAEQNVLWSDESEYCSERRLYMKLRTTREARSLLRKVQANVGVGSVFREIESLEISSRGEPFLTATGVEKVENSTVILSGRTGYCRWSVRSRPWPWRLLMTLSMTFQVSTYARRWAS